VKGFIEYRPMLQKFPRKRRNKQSLQNLLKSLKTPAQLVINIHGENIIIGCFLCGCLPTAQVSLKFVLADFENFACSDAFLETFATFIQ